MGRAFEFRKARKLKRWSKMSKTFTRIGKDIVIAVKDGHGGGAFRWARWCSLRRGRGRGMGRGGLNETSHEATRVAARARWPSGEEEASCDGASRVCCHVCCRWA